MKRSVELRRATHVAIDRATVRDATAIAEVYLASRADALSYLPRVHREHEIRIWIRDVVVRRFETWVARLDGRIVGFMSLVEDELDQLYIAPAHVGCGIGTCLVKHAKARRPQRLRLFTFQRNMRARGFYEAHGFYALDFNDGSRNEEGEPDVCYEWFAATAG